MHIHCELDHFWGPSARETSSAASPDEPLISHAPNGTRPALHQSSLERFAATFRAGLFGLTYSLSKSHEKERWSGVFALALSGIQMLSFPLNSSSSMPWSDIPAIGDFARGLDFITTDRMDETHSPLVFRIVLGIAMSWTAIFLALALTVAVSFAKDLPQNALVLRSLRRIARLSTTFLFLPFTAILFRTIACPSKYATWMDTGWACDGSERVVVAVLAAVLLIAFSFLALFVAATFVNRDPSSESWAAKSHGRVDIALLSIKLFLGFLFNVVDEQVMGTAFVTILLIAVGVVWIGLYLRFMPFVHPHVNAVEVGFGAAFLWSAVGLALAQMTPDANFVFFIYFGAPLAFGFGFLLCLLRERAIAEREPDALVNSHEIELWARAKLRSWRRAIDLDAGVPRKLGEVDRVMDRASVPSVCAMAVMTSASAKRSSKATQLLEEAESVYRAAYERFPHDSNLFVFASCFFREHSMYHYDEAIALSRAKKLEPALDAQYHIYERTRQLREADKSGMSTVDRILFDQQVKEAKTLRIEAFRQLVVVWETLGRTSPDSQRLQGAGVTLLRLLTRIDGLYTGLLRTNPNSTSVLRAYATHLMELANEPARAMELLNKADRIEEANSKQRNRIMRHITLGANTETQDLMDERSAVITISADSATLGEIVGVSAAACRIFGYASTQLVGQNINLIVPQPFRANHNAFLHRFAKTGRSTMVNRSRMLFGATKSGVIMPMWIQFSEAPPDEETCAPRFTAVMTPVVTNENHFIFGFKDAGFRLYAASSRSFSLLGLDPERAAEDTISLAPWFPSLSPSFRARKQTFAGPEAAALRTIPSAADLLSADHASTSSSSARGRGPGLGLRTSTSNNLAASDSVSESLDNTELMRELQVTIRPLLEARTVSLIPVRNAADGTEFIVGSVQTIQPQGMEPFGLLRWHAIQHPVMPGRVPMPAQSRVDNTDESVGDSDNVEGGSLNATGFSDDGGENDIAVGSIEEDDKWSDGAVGSQTARDVALVPHSALPPGHPPVPSAYGRLHEEEHEKLEEVEGEDGVAEVQNEANEIDDSPLVGVRGTPMRSIPRNAPNFTDPTALASATTEPVASSSEASAAGAAAAASALMTPLPSVLPSISASKYLRSVVGPKDGAAGALTTTTQTDSRGTSVFRVGRSHRVHPGSQPTVTDASDAPLLSRQPTENRPGAGSVASAGSKMTTQLKRTLTVHHSGMEPDVRLARKTVLALVVAVFLLLIGAVVFVRTLREDITAVMDGLWVSGERLLAFQASVARVRELKGINDGYSVLGNLNSSAALLEDSANELQGWNIALNQFTTDGGARGHAFDTGSEFELVEVDASGAVSQRISTPLSEASQTIAANFLRLSRVDPTTVVASHPDVVNLMANEDVVRRAMNTSQLWRSVDIKERVDEAEKVLFSVAGVFFFFAVLVSTIVFLHVVRSLAQRSHRIARTLLFIPTGHAKLLQRRWVMQLQRAVNEDDEEGTSDEELGEEVPLFTADDDDEKPVHPRPRALSRAGESIRGSLGGGGGGGAHLPPVRISLAGGSGTAGDGKGPVMPATSRHSVVNVGPERTMSSAAAGRPRRSFKDARGDFVRNTAFLTLPVVGILGWLVFLVVEIVVLRTHVHHASDRMMFLQQSSSLIVEYSDTVADVLLAPTAAERVAHIDRAVELDRQVVQMTRLVVLGGTAVYDVVNEDYDIPALSPDSIADPLFHADACVDPATRVACRAIEEGAMAEGLLAGSMTAMSIGRKLVASAKSATGDGPLTDAARLAQLGRLHELESVHVRAAMAEGSRLLRSEASAALEADAVVMTTVSIVFVFCFVIFAFGYYWPVLEDMALPIRSAHGLLTLIPEETIHSNPDLKMALRAVVTESQLGAEAKSK